MRRRHSGVASSPEELNRLPLPSIENAFKPNDHIGIWPQKYLLSLMSPSFCGVRVDGERPICQPLGVKEDQKPTIALAAQE